MKRTKRIQIIRCDEHYVMYGIVESIYCASEADILYVNYIGIIKNK